MIHYPLEFHTSADSNSGINSAWLTEASAFAHSIPVSIPKEFEGPGLGLSPEDLYAITLQNCFIATFKVFAEKSRLQFDSIHIDSKLEVDRDEIGKPWMARIHFKIRLSGVAQIDNAKRILERTSQNCMILNSVKTAKTFEYEVLG